MNAVYGQRNPDSVADPRTESTKSGITTNGSAVLTVAEVAMDLRSSKAHVCNIIAGRVRGVTPLAVLRLGRRILVRRSTLEEWKSRCEQGV